MRRDGKRIVRIFVRVYIIYRYKVHPTRGVVQLLFIFVFCFFSSSVGVGVTRIIYESEPQHRYCIPRDFRRRNPDELARNASARSHRRRGDSYLFRHSPEFTGKKISIRDNIFIIIIIIIGYIDYPRTRIQVGI